jgi:hypothetical protein
LANATLTQLQRPAELGTHFTPQEAAAFTLSDENLRVV